VIGSSKRLTGIGSGTLALGVRCVAPFFGAWGERGISSLVGCTHFSGSPLLLVQQANLKGSVRELALGSIQNALTQQIEVSPSVHGSFDQFELVYLTFCLPVAVRER
jgi:hypothetical protein